MAFAGPLYVKDIYEKNDQMFKSYICLFTCATTRNVHLELTPSMDASDVIKALVRFLKEVSKFLLLHNIDWRFILPLPPWCEGFYERDLSEQLRTLYKRYQEDQS